MITLANLFQCFLSMKLCILQMIQLVIDRRAQGNDELSHECNKCKARRDNRNNDLSSRREDKRRKKTGTEN